MNDLRKAAEMALEALEDIFGKEKKDVGAINALRHALAHEALNRMVAENQRLGLYDDGPAVKTYAGGKPNYCTPEETPEVTPEVLCKTHPDAPHGFDRNASHSADRYVCECEGWEPPEQKTLYMDMSQVPTGMPGWKPGMVVPAAKREWVGLTDEEIADVWKTEYFNLSYELPRAIEAKLKEKNGG